MAKKPTTPAPGGPTRYVSYYWVSTKKQGESGLGLEAQQRAVTDFVKGQIVATYTEIESGENNQRQQLAAAIDHAKWAGAVLVIAKLDRLSRNASFIFALKDSGGNFQCVDMPEANTLTIGIFATLAQHEHELISSRTRAALAEKKAQGKVLGRPDHMNPAVQAKGVAGNVRRAQANENNQRASYVIENKIKQGATYAEVAAELNRVGFRTFQGCLFQATQVMRLYKSVLGN